jgi:hypothetical protein
MTQQYTILDNGGEPFKIKISKNHLRVFSYNNEDDIDYNKLVYETDFNNIFIGRHPISEKMYAEDFDIQYDGNSILVEIDDYEYVFIGMNIFKFNSLNKINYYLSIVGNNCVPYPYAIDISNNIYLMIENAIIIPEDDTFEYIKEIGEPYCFYYGHIPNKNYEYIKHQLPNYKEIVERI